MHKYIGRFALLIFGCVFALAFLELSMIVLEPWVFNKGFYQYDRELGFRVRAGFNGTNRFGFNDREYALERKAGTFRILVLGDSFGWSGGREGNYTAILERACQNQLGDGRIEVNQA